MSFVLFRFRQFQRLIAAVLAICLLACGSATAQQAEVFNRFNTGWLDNPTWHDGKAEDATYEASRPMYGQPRSYEATIYTNTEHASAETKTKAPDGWGRPVFKVHLREDVPTENYEYHFSSMTYVGRPDLKSLKIDFGSMEDCGATFKQFVNHAGELTWQQFSYFPNQGHRAGNYSPPADLVYHSALPLVLRGYPFDRPREVKVSLLPDQVSNKWSPYEPVPAVIRYVGRETLDLPVGQVEAHHLRVTTEGENKREGETERSYDYWFAAEGGAPLLHVMVQYEGADGTTYRLKNHRRWAYWEGN